MQVAILEVKPFIEKFNNRLEVFNESCVMILGSIMFLYTPFVKDSDVKFNIGWIMIAITVLQILVNLIIMTIMSFGECKRF